MALNEIERMTLTQARDRIRKGQDQYVCYAIDKTKLDARKYTLEQHRAARARLKSYIITALGGLGTNSLTWWVHQHTRDHTVFLPRHLQDETRIAWITWMLDEPLPEMSAELKAFMKAHGVNPKKKYRSY